MENFKAGIFRNEKNGENSFFKRVPSLEYCFERKMKHVGVYAAFSVAKFNIMPCFVYQNVFFCYNYFNGYSV